MAPVGGERYTYTQVSTGHGIFGAHPTVKHNASSSESQGCGSDVEVQHFLPDEHMLDIYTSPGSLSWGDSSFDARWISPSSPPQTAKFPRCVTFLEISKAPAWECDGFRALTGFGPWQRQRGSSSSRRRSRSSSSSSSSSDSSTRLHRFVGLTAIKHEAAGSRGAGLSFVAALRC